MPLGYELSSLDESLNDEEREKDKTPKTAAIAVCDSCKLAQLFYVRVDGHIESLNFVPPEFVLSRYGIWRHQHIKTHLIKKEVNRNGNS